MSPQRAVGLVIAIVAGTSCTTWVAWRDTPQYLLGGATAELAAEVVPVVRTKTKENVIQVERLRDGTVKVETGYFVPYRRGAGRVFVLKKIQGRWQIIDEAIWMV